MCAAAAAPTSRSNKKHLIVLARTLSRLSAVEMSAFPLGTLLQNLLCSSSFDCDEFRLRKSEIRTRYYEVMVQM